MNREQTSVLARLAGAAVLTVVFIACSGGNTDGGEAVDNAANFGDDHFVADDDSVGRIEVDVVETEIQVSRTSGFFARVRDASGAPVENIKVSCDSEDGVAILEPTTGTEITDSQGNISGVIGCAAPGSLIFGCRVPVGANKRKFVTIKCRGPIPQGFSGFPGASGGGLGTGGVADSDDAGVGGVNPDGVRVTSIQAADLGGDARSTSIDTRQSICDDDTAEPFFDSTLFIKVENNSNSTIRFTKMNYTVDNAFGNGSANFNSTDLSLVGEVAASGGSSEFSVLGFDAGSGGKTFAGSSTPIPAGLGFRNLTVRLYGTTDLGDAVTVTGRTALSFDNFDNCP